MLSKIILIATATLLSALAISCIPIVYSQMVHGRRSRAQGYIMLTIYGATPFVAGVLLGGVLL